ncbi:helix-turn-helix domain-containing protein [Rheinheimera sp. UJ51]|uniref:helix-turn-helix domain-containing protein n=1 Tax=Rheinheimera sp. UJ51 TaxID=2892446 RepID=UPI001E656194|nr:helix-turn-helix transcriptional regulator [Rheinheimera sp. UJ51]MCC5451683.1 helix-turn-helix domain-containing protein [Rheinheimera sp. UJ51]
MSKTMVHGGQLLKTVRRKLGLTQEELCELADLKVRTYQRWENKLSEPSFSTVCNICRNAFNMSLLDALKFADLTL